MARPTFYRLGLIFPYVFPLLALPLWNVLDALPGFLTSFLGFSFLSAFVWAIPYLPIAIALLVWSRGRSPERIKGGFLLAPILLAAAVAIFSLLFSSLFSEAGDRLASIGALAGLTLLVGYAFIALWLVLEALLSRLGAFH